MYIGFMGNRHFSNMEIMTVTHLPAGLQLYCLIPEHCSPWEQISILFNQMSAV